MGCTACTEPQCLYKAALYLVTCEHARVLHLWGYSWNVCCGPKSLECKTSIVRTVMEKLCTVNNNASLDFPQKYLNFVIYVHTCSYNKIQQDALFLNFILVKNSTCFGQSYWQSSGVLILYSQQLVFVVLVTLRLSASEVRMDSKSARNIQSSLPK